MADDNWNNPPSLDEFLEEFRLALKDAAETDAEFRRLEKLENVVFSEIVNHIEGSISAREHLANESSRYKDHLEALYQARKQKNLADAKVKWLETRFEAWRSRNATKRAEMQLA